MLPALQQCVETFKSEDEFSKLFDLIVKDKTQYDLDINFPLGCLIEAKPAAAAAFAQHDDRFFPLDGTAKVNPELDT